MAHFQLFRVSVIQPAQIGLFPGGRRSASEILREAILTKPSREIRRGSIWHVGNIVPLDEFGIYFAFGRTTKATMELYDQTVGDFVEQMFEAAPYTYIVADVSLQVFAIAAKPSLARRPAGIARQLARVLDEAPAVKAADAHIEVGEVKDPEDFLSYLSFAHSIYHFSVTFSRPNPWDVERDFHEPMRKYLAAANGEKGESAIAGENLNSDVLAQVTRSAAAAGNDAEARLRMAAGEKPIRKRLRENPVELSEEEPQDLIQKRSLLERIRSLYARVRGK